MQHDPTLVHVTERIQSSGGIRKMQRNHIHFATGIPYMDGTKNDSVISVMRKSCDGLYLYKFTQMYHGQHSQLQK